MFSSRALNEAGPPALAVSALFVALLTQFAITERWDVPRPWLGFVPAALLLGAAALLMARARNTAAQAEPIVFTRRQELLLLAGVIALAAFFRFWRFYAFPQGIWFDEGINATDAIYIIDRDHFVLWRDTVQGRPTLYLYLLAGSFKMFGYTMFALRIVPVAAGLAAVIAFYFLARTLIGVVPAIVSTALFAVSRWATTFSRISWEAALVPLFEILAVYFLIRALEARSKLFFALAGVSLAGGLYTYVAFRIVPVVLLMFLAYVAVSQWRLLWRNLPGIAIYAASFFVVVAPLAYFAITNQDRVLERTRNVNVFQEVDDRGSWEPLRFNIEANIKMMNVEGDRNGRHNIHREPMLDEVTAALFVLGLAVSVWSLRDWRRGGIGIWYVLMLVPAALTITIENPSGIRAIGALPPIFLLAGMAVATTYRAIAPMRNGAAIFAGLAVMLVGGSTVINYYDLFERQVEDQFVYDGFEPHYRYVGEIVASEADERTAYVSRAFDGQPGVKMLTNGQTVHPYVPVKDIIFPDDGRDALVMMDVTQFSMMSNLQKLYPNAVKEDDVDRYGRTLFAKVTIPAADIAAQHQIETTVNGAPAEPIALNREWTEDDLADGPITVEWAGQLWVDTFPGRAQVEAQAPGAIAIEIDGALTEGEDSVVALPGELTFGEHDIRVRAVIERPGRLDLTVDTDGIRADGTDAVYRTTTGERGLRALHRADGGFASAPTQIGHMPYAAAAPPITPRATVELQGVLDVATEGEYGFALEGWNSVQLFVDGSLVVDNGGAHSMRRVEGVAMLPPGEHVVSIQYTSSDFPGWSISWRRPGEDWRPMDGSEFRVPTTPYVAPALVTLTPDVSWREAGAATIDGVDRAMGVAVLPAGDIVLVSSNRMTFLGPGGDVLRSTTLDARQPVDIVLTDNGYFVVLDAATDDVLILDVEGNEVRRITGGVASSGGLGVAGNRVYLTSPAGGLAYALDVPDGEISGLPLTNPNVSPRASQPSDVATSADGKLFLSDFEKQTVIVGTEIGPELSLPGVGGSGLQVPRLVTLGDLVIVSEPVAERIRVFDRAGKQRGVYVFSPELKGVRPTGMAVSQNGDLYVVDLEHGRVYRFKIELPQEASAPLPE